MVKRALAIVVLAARLEIVRPEIVRPEIITERSLIAVQGHPTAAVDATVVDPPDRRLAHLLRCHNDRSQSAFAQARRAAPRFWRHCPRSSALSLSLLFRGCQPCDKG
jgi:hypothetical protein